MKLGVVLPQFRDTAADALVSATEAEALGLDGVFVFDHLWPIGAPERPALHGMTLLGAIAAGTDRITIGTLVARVSLMDDEVLVRGFTTLREIAGDRVIAGIGTGDHLSEPENLAYGVPFPSAAERRAQLADCCRRLRAQGLPTWVGGLSRETIAVAGREADGLNLWGVGPEVMAGAVDDLVREVGGRDFALSWGGPVLVARNEELAAGRLRRMGPRQGLVHGTLDAVTAHFRLLAEAGATWVICAPLDWSVPVEELELLAELAETLR